MAAIKHQNEAFAEERKRFQTEATNKAALAAQGRDAMFKQHLAAERVERTKRDRCSDSKQLHRLKSTFQSRSVANHAAHDEYASSGIIESKRSTKPKLP
jgi:hypothetical protein